MGAVEINLIFGKFYAAPHKVPEHLSVCSFGCLDPLKMIFIIVLIQKVPALKYVICFPPLEHCLHSELSSYTDTEIWRMLQNSASHRGVTRGKIIF